MGATEEALQGETHKTTVLKHVLPPQKLQSCGAGTQWKTGRTPEMGKNGIIAFIKIGEKMAEKMQKKKENRANFPFWGYFEANFPRFSHLWRWPVFHCVPAPLQPKSTL